MKHSPCCSDYKSHCWAGVYLSAVTPAFGWAKWRSCPVYEPPVQGLRPIPRRILRGNCGVTLQDNNWIADHERVDGEPWRPIQ